MSVLSEIIGARREWSAQKRKRGLLSRSIQWTRDWAIIAALGLGLYVYRDAVLRLLHSCL